MIFEGEFFFLRDLCGAQSRGERSPTSLKRLTSRDIISRLSLGKTPEEIFMEVLGDADLDGHGGDARALIANRFTYISRDMELPVPDLPYLKELKTYVRNHKER